MRKPCAAGLRRTLRNSVTVHGRATSVSPPAGIAGVFHQTGRAPMKFFAKSSASPSLASVRFVRLACAVFGGRFAPDSGLLSSPIVPAIGFVGCTQFRTQTVSPNSRALVKYPG